MRNIAQNAVYDWLSYDILRFKIEVGVEEKSMCKKRNKTNATWPLPLPLPAAI